MSIFIDKVLSLLLQISMISRPYFYQDLVNLSIDGVGPTALIKMNGLVEKYKHINIALMK